jgi:hypothetical protein
VCCSAMPRWEELFNDNVINEAIPLWLAIMAHTSGSGLKSHAASLHRVGTRCR